MMDVLKKYIIKIFKMGLVIFLGLGFMFSSIFLRENPFLISTVMIVLIVIIRKIANTSESQDSLKSPSLAHAQIEGKMGKKTLPRDLLLEGFESPLEPKYGAFQMGLFPCKIFREMTIAPETMPSGRQQDRFVVTTTLTVEIPPVRTFGFRISNVENSRGDRDDSLERVNRSSDEFISSLRWDVPEQELLQALQTPDAIHWIRCLFILGKGTIASGEGIFSIQIQRALQGEERLDFFVSTSKALFRIYARTAQMNVLEWRFPQNNYDWWREDDEKIF